ncbi:MAG: outer membrane beta-barrel protein, partial [Muribaculaceae bacterium]|nr:outer membrane beta-barrel protein [Muribaculaceae bacterium]
EEIMQMVNKLPEGYGKVFRLSVFEGLSHKEIAEALGIEPHSSSSQLARAKKMMRKMIKQYWVWLLIPLLIPVSVIILYYKQSARDKKTSDLPKTTGVKMYKSNTSIAHLPINSKQSSSYETYLSSGVKITEVLTPDSVSGIMEQHEACPPIIYGKEQPDTVSAILLDTVSTVYRIEPPKYNPVALRHKETKDHRGWNMYVAYSGSVQGDRSRTNDYMSMPSLSKGITRSTRIYNWGEYIEYVMENSENMDSLSALNMRRIALINSNTPQEPLTEKSNHERPLTIQLLLNRQFNRHWSFTAGLSFNRLKSTFESGNEKTLIYRTQRIHYLGVPLKVNFHIMDDYRFTLYTSGGIQLDFPVNARLTTNYRYSNAYGHIDDSQDINAKIHAPCQLSFGVGVGLQYEILPHVNVFLEPSLNYYIPNGQGIETYRTVHPLDVSIPIGIKLCW